MSVYFARVKGYVKIGYSAKPWERVGTIASGTSIKPDDVDPSDEVDLFGWVPGDRHTETSMHRRFGPLGVVGEWFWDDDAYERLIVEHPHGVPLHDVSMHVAVWMQRDPQLSRADAMTAFRLWSEANPSGFDAEFVAGIRRRAVDERAADRAHWRSLRTAA